MEAPAPLRFAADEREDVTITRREYECENVVAGDRQFEFEVPADATEVATNDGMLVIREAAAE